MSTFVQVDNRGNRLIVTDDSDINTPAVAAAYATKRYSKQAQDEISFEVGENRTLSIETLSNEALNNEAFSNETLSSEALR